MPEEQVEEVEAKRQQFEALHSGGLGWQMKIACDLWVTAFFATKATPPESRGRELVPTTDKVWQYMRQPSAVYAPLLAEVNRLAHRNRVLHWPIAVPEVFVRGGFDVNLGNPPWERIKLQEQEFFASRSPEIAQAPNKAARDRLIKALTRPDATPAEQALYREFVEAKREAEAASQFMRAGSRY